VTEDTKSSLVGFAAFGFIGGFFFPPLFAVGIFLLIIAYFPTKGLAEQARRLRDESALRLVECQLLAPLQARHKVAVFQCSIKKELQADPELERIFNSIEIELPEEETPPYRPIDVNRSVADLKSLLPANAELSERLVQVQARCARELRRIRLALQEDPALLEVFREVKISGAPETLDAFKAFASLGGAGAVDSRSLDYEIDAIDRLVRPGSKSTPKALLNRMAASLADANRQAATLEGRRAVSSPPSLASLDVRAEVETASSIARLDADSLRDMPIPPLSGSGSGSRGARPSSMVPPIVRARSTRRLKRSLTRQDPEDHQALQRELDAYEETRREEREVSYELLRQELSALYEEKLHSGSYAVLGSWQEELGGAALLESEVDPISSEDLLLYLSERGVKKLYHFTDRENIPSIISNGGLYSWAYCEANGLAVHRPGGSELSRQLDLRKGLQDYVRLCFVKDHPMMYAALKERRIVDPVILEIDLEAVGLSDVLFSDRNAVANGANVGSGLDALGEVRFDVIQRGRWRTDEEKGFYQAEVLVRDVVPGYLIRHEGRLIRARSKLDFDDDIPF
jgi:hypothetical protein